MRRFKSCRLPKREYTKKEKERKGEKFCHKKKNGVSTKLKIISIDDNGNKICANCKMVLISKDITDESEFNTQIRKLELMGGVWNCCYDCNFSWYCNKCCFTIIYKTSRFRTCGNAFMKQLLKPNYLSGRYSSGKNEEHWTYSRKFFETEIKYGLRKNSLVGAIANVEKIIKYYRKPDSKNRIRKYKNQIKKYKQEVILLDMNEPIELLEDEKYREKYYYYEKGEMKIC
jgi:hypothetical protein